MSRKHLTRILAGIIAAAALFSGAAVLAAPGQTSKQTQPLRILFRVPDDGGTISLSSGSWERTYLPDGNYAVLEAPPGDYTLRCGSLSAALRLGEQTEVLGGCAAWDGEVLRMGQCGTLELLCRPLPGQQLAIHITAADGVHSRSAAHDPELNGAAVVHRLSLPAGTVTVACGGYSQSLTLRPGETQTLNIE